jgi:hypothetical protein
MWFEALWKWYNKVVHRAIVGLDPRAKNILSPGTCGASYFRQACQEYDRLVAYSAPPGVGAPASPNPAAGQASSAYQKHVAELRNTLPQKYDANSLTWDELYGFQIAMLGLYPPAELRTKRASLKDYFYKLAPKRSIESYERTSPPPLTGDTKYEDALADAIFLQSEVSKIETYRPHQEFKRNRITFDLFSSLVVTLIVYFLFGLIAVLILRFSHTGLSVAFPCLIVAMMLGALGAVVSSQRRLQTSFDEDASILNTTRYVGSGLGTRLTPVLGSVFSGVLVVLIYSGLFSTAANLVVPAVQQISTTTATKPGFLEFIVLGPDSLVEYAKIVVYAFLAGFAERLVPDTLDRLALNASKT